MVIHQRFSYCQWAEGPYQGDCMKGFGEARKDVLLLRMTYHEYTCILSIASKNTIEGISHAVMLDAKEIMITLSWSIPCMTFHPPVGRASARTEFQPFFDFQPVRAHVFPLDEVLTDGYASAGLLSSLLQLPPSTGCCRYQVRHIKHVVQFFLLFFIPEQL